MTQMAREYYEIPDWNLAIYLEDDILKSVPIGAQGICDDPEYEREVDIESFKDEEDLYLALKEANSQLRG